MAAGGDANMGQDGVKKIVGLLRDYFALDAAYSAYQEIVRFSQFKRPARAMDGNLARFDLLRCKS